MSSCTFSNPGWQDTGTGTAPKRLIPDLIDKADVNKCNENFPHKCPHCGAAAYVGLNAVDCRAKCPRSEK